MDNPEAIVAAEPATVNLGLDQQVPVPPVMEAIQTPATPEPEETVETSNSIPNGFEEPYENEWLMTRVQIGRSRSKKLKTYKFRIATLQYQTNGTLALGWWKEFGNGTVPSKFDAFVFNYDYIIQLSNSLMDTMFYVEHKEPDPSVKRRRCKWGTMLGPALVEMIRTQPKNATFRAKMCAILKEMPPDDCTTVESLKDWVEYTFPRSVGEIKKEPECIELKVNYSYKESGQCKYTRIISGSHNVKLSNETILRASHEFEHIDDLMNSLVDNVETIAADNGSENVVDDTEETREHVSNDREDTDFSVGGDLRDHVVRLLRIYMSEDDAADYGI